MCLCDLEIQATGLDSDDGRGWICRRQRGCFDLSSVCKNWKLKRCLLSHSPFSSSSFCPKKHIKAQPARNHTTPCHSQATHYITRLVLLSVRRWRRINPFFCQPMPFHVNLASWADLHTTKPCSSSRSICSFGGLSYIYAVYSTHRLRAVNVPIMAFYLASPLLPSSFTPPKTVIFAKRTLFFISSDRTFHSLSASKSVDRRIWTKWNTPIYELYWYKIVKCWSAEALTVSTHNVTVGVFLFF